MKKILYYVSLFIPFLSCTDKQTSVVEIIDINSSEKIEFSSLFEEYHLIFPQATDSSLWGIDVGRLEKYGDRIYVLDQLASGKRVFCYDEKGDFLFPVSRLGNGPGEYADLCDMFIDAHDKKLVLIDNLFTWKYYDLDGKYIESKQLYDVGITIRRVNDYNDSLYVAYNECYEKNCNDVIFINKKSLEMTKGLRPTEPKLPDMGPSIPISLSGGESLYCSSMDTVYNFSFVNGLTNPLYFVDFGTKHKKSKKELIAMSESSYDQDEVMQFFLRKYESNEFYLMLSIVENKSFVVFSYMLNKDNEKSKYRSLSHNFVGAAFYNKANKKTYSTLKMDFDILNSVEVNLFSILLSSDGYFYAVIYDRFDEDQIKRISQSQFLADEEKLQILQFNEDSNPLLLKFK
jgi:hypothetical protein